MTTARRTPAAAAGAAMVAAVMLLTSCTARLSTSHPSIRNFHEIAPGTGIYRGGQLNNTAAWEHLHTLGVKRIVKLNTTRMAEEPKTARKYRMEVIAAPMNEFAMWISGPEQAVMDRAVAAIRPGTYIHCQRGRDRTGLVVGAYQVQVLGKKKHEAYREMMHRGFGNMPGMLLWWLFSVHPRRG